MDVRIYHGLLTMYVLWQLIWFLNMHSSFWSYVWFSLLGTKGARKAIMLVTINDYWLYQLVPFFVMHSIYLVLGDQFCLFPNNILSRQFVLRRPKRVAVPANLRVSITKADDKERLVFGGLQKKSCELNGILIDFLFSMSDFAALGLSQLCSFKINHGGKNVSIFRENSKLWLISFEKPCLHSDMVSYFYVDKTTDFKLLMINIFQVFAMDVMKLKD